MVVAVSTRYIKTKDTGVYSLRVGRPTSYLLKHMLHLVIAIALVLIIVASCLSKPYTLYNYIRIVVSGGQLLTWIFSALMLKFEYRRQCGHIWYMHPLLFWFSVVLYLTDLFYQMFGLEDSDTRDNPKLSSITLVLTVILLIVTLVLAVLVNVYPMDNHRERRDYFPLI